MLKEVRTAAGCSADSVTELCNWLERAVEHRVNGIIIYVYKVVEVKTSEGK